jgi:NarL family two-component system sensor histidine kinase LiaS
VTTFALVVLAIIALQVIWSGASGLLYAYVVRRGLSRRLGRLADTSAALASGELSRRIVDHSTDEIGQLGRQFNTMADQLSDNVQELRRLADQNAQLAAEARQLATVEERNRLARELHDSVKQQVFAASMQLGAAQELRRHDPPAAMALTQAAATSIEQAKRDLTAIIPALRPPELERTGLAQAAHDYLRVWERQTGIATIRHIDLGGATLPLDVEQALFRILQEALTNIARHSQATEVRCVLHVRAARVELQISDNGIGFNANHVHEGVGLRSMRERAGEIGGALAINSDAGGANVHVTVEYSNST